MTVGIYRLVFNGTDKVYIGQSVNIEKRYKQHLNNITNGTANYKLREAFSMYGLPRLDILVECEVSELDDSEEESIEIFNSVDNGLNIYKYSSQAPTYTGEYGYGNTKYSREQLLETLILLVDMPDLGYDGITKATGVPAATISGIANMSQNIWLAKEYPDIYTKLTSFIGKRGKQATIVSNKLSAKSRGIIYPRLRDPSGRYHTIDNAYRFAKEHNLAGNHLTEVLNGHRKSHKGWQICPEDAV